MSKTVSPTWLWHLISPGSCIRHSSPHPIWWPLLSSFLDHNKLQNNSFWQKGRELRELRRVPCTHLSSPGHVHCGEDTKRGRNRWSAKERVEPNAITIFGQFLILHAKVVWLLKKEKYEYFHWLNFHAKEKSCKVPCTCKPVIDWLPQAWEIV